jgi:hypothetical protein
VAEEKGMIEEGSELYVLEEKVPEANVVEGKAVEENGVGEKGYAGGLDNGSRRN